jgi:BirA family transcriptional regulator, biotin operon repressor / biotin---[acetyl-CoA-carboxylase] ligase
MLTTYFIPQTLSTNALLRQMVREQDLADGFVVHTDFQEAGKGQAGNSWESAEGENLLFSMVLYPVQIAIEEQFLLSQLVSVAIKRALDEYVEDISVKWPNDIYWKDKKLAGILIESSLQGARIKSMVVGVGLNVNQTEFVSNAPNPVSLRQIIGHPVDRMRLLDTVRDNILELYAGMDAGVDAERIRAEYAQMLYRKQGLHLFKAGEEHFEASIHAVHPDGKLELKTEDGQSRGFYFKEVGFVV